MFQGIEHGIALEPERVSPSFEAALSRDLLCLTSTLEEQRILALAV